MLKFLSKNFHFLILMFISFAVYYKLFLLGKIPFPGDLLVGSYYPWLDYYKIPIQNPLISDVFSQVFLWKYLSIEIFRSWQWPLWNPYSFTGTPLLASYQSAVLYPLNILLLLPKYFGWGLFIFSQTLIAVIGMYLLLSLWLPSKLARLTGSVIFAFGGLMTTWLELGVPVHAMIWLPICFYFVECYYFKFQVRYLMLLIISLSLLILAGYAQIVVFSFAVLFGYIVVKSKKFSTHFLPPTVCLVLSLLLCNIQLLPTLDLLNKSIRLTESYTREFNFGLLPLQDLLKFFVADFFGNPVTGNYWGSLNYSEGSGFVGSLTLPLLIFSLFYLKKTKIVIFFQLVLAFSILLTFSNPLSQIIYQIKIPLLTSSYASRMLFISCFSIAILSAYSLNQILNYQNQKNKFFKSIIWSWSIMMGILIGSSYSYILSGFAIPFRNSILPLLLSTSLLVLYKFFNLKPLLVCFVLFLLLTLDLSRYFLKYNPFVSQALIYPQVPALQFLQKQPGLFRVGREHAEVLPPNTWTAYGLSSYEGYDPLYLNQYGKFMHFLNGGDLRTGSSSRYAEISANYSSAFIDITNARFFIGIYREKNGFIPFSKTVYKKVFEDKSTIVFENPDALERVFIASSVIVLTQSEIDNMVMTDKSFDPRKKVALTDDLGVKNPTGSGSATILKYSPNEISIKTNTSNDEILVLSDQYEDGWSAKVDGKQTKITRANLIFRAVKIPSGNHEVVFYYWPKSFETGLKITTITTLLIILIALFSVKLRIF